MILVSSFAKTLLFHLVLCNDKDKELGFHHPPTRNITKQNTSHHININITSHAAMLLLARRVHQYINVRKTESNG